MTRLSSFVLALSVAVTPVRSHAQAQAQAPTGTARWADSLSRLIALADVRQGNDLPQAIALADRVLSVTPDDGSILHYKALALYRTAQRLLGTPAKEDEAKAMLEEADQLLERSATRLKWPETYALRSSVIGQLIGIGGMMAGMRLGSKADALMDDAVALGPNNPRVLLLRGVSAMYKPKMFGGGMDKAEKDLTRAATLFASDRPASPLPSWGHAETYAWLGQLHVAEKRPAEARAAYAKALELQPEYGWVKYQLLPALDKGKP